MSWAEKCFYLILVLHDKPFKWSPMQIPWLEIICWKSESAKMTQNGLSSHKCIFWLQPYRSFKKSTRNLRGINYQMEYMWWAPHNNKNSPGLQLGSQLRCTLYRSFIPTLYKPISHLSICSLCTKTQLEFSLQYKCYFRSVVLLLIVFKNDRK